MEALRLTSGLGRRRLRRRIVLGEPACSLVVGIEAGRPFLLAELPRALVGEPSLSHELSIDVPGQPDNACGVPATPSGDPPIPCRMQLGSM
jgi:hypothetical protein